MLKSSVVKVPKASELVAANMRRRIITGQLEPGDLLPSEAMLMREFGVSRPTLREAFRLLESEAIIEVLRGSRGGGRVLEPSGAVAAVYMGILLQYQGTPLSDLYRARTELSVSALGLLTVARRKQLSRRIEELAHQAGALIAEEDEEAFAVNDFHVHSAIADATGSTTLVALSEMLAHIVDAHNMVFIAAHPRGFSIESNKKAQRAYLRVAKLLGDGEVEHAQRSWRRHLEAVERYMVIDGDATLIEVLS